METRRVRGARHDGDGRVLSGRGGAECPANPGREGRLDVPARVGWQVSGIGIASLVGRER